MNIQVSKRDILHLATRAASVTEKKSTMPVLETLLLEVSGDRVNVAGTDLYSAVRDSCPAEVTKPGAVAVSAADLVARIKQMADGPVSLSVNDKGALTIKSVGLARKFTLRTMDGADYPPIPKPNPDEPRLTLDAVVLASLIAHTKFSVSADATRPHLNSLQFEWNDDLLRCVSTDGHRLSKAEHKVSGQASLEMLLPLKAVTAIHELASSIHGDAEHPATLQIIKRGPTAFFVAGTATFSVKLVDATFPPWKQVLPASSERVVRAPRAVLLDALRAVSIAASEKGGGVKLLLSKGKIQLRSESPESGDGDDEIPIEYAGSNMSVGFNARYLIEALGVLSSDEVELGLNNELDPMTIKPVQDAGTDFVGVCMPMRI